MSSAMAPAAEERLYVWGSGGSGQLGLGDENDYALPQRFASGKIFPWSVSTGGRHSAGRGVDGQLYLWGADDNRQLGRSTAQREAKSECVSRPEHPAAVIPQTHATEKVVLGWCSSVAVVTERATRLESVYSWGSNDYRQLGRDSRRADAEDASSIVEFPFRLRVQSVSCGWKHVLLATTEGAAFAWGTGRHGQLGLGDTTLKTDVPTRVEALKSEQLVQVLCGWEHSIFRASSGEVFTCGSNRHGQLGTPEPVTAASTTSKPKRKSVNPLPTRVLAAGGASASLIVTEAACGWHFVLCLTATNELVSWGKGSHGQLGLGTTSNVSEPTRVPFPFQVKQFACGSEHVLVVTDDGDLYTCGWGEHGNLGHGDNANRTSLEKVAFFASAEEKVVSAKAGGAVSLALTIPRGSTGGDVE